MRRTTLGRTTQTWEFLWSCFPSVAWLQRTVPSTSQSLRVLRRRMAAGSDQRSSTPREPWEVFSEPSTAAPLPRAPGLSEEEIELLVDLLRRAQLGCQSLPQRRPSRAAGSAGSGSQASGSVAAGSGIQGPGTQTPGDQAFGEARHYAVWSVPNDQEACGIWTGAYPRVWRELERRLPRGRYEGSQAHLRRAASFEAAVEIWHAEARRRGVAAEDMIIHRH
jgi:hypothetical protein